LPDDGRGRGDAKVIDSLSVEYHANVESKAASVSGEQHVVQFFGCDHERLTLNVGRYLSDSLRGGGGAMIVADSARSEAILRNIRERLGSALQSQPIVLLDHRETLDRFMLDGRLDAARFDACVGAAVRELHERCGSFRTYGEMVGTLWSQGERSAAIALERSWNDLRSRVPFGLYCGYPVDVLAEEFQIGSMRGVLCNHTNVVSALPHTFELAMQRAMDDLFGDRGQGMRGLTAGNFASLEASIPPAERTILHLRSTFPRYVDDIIGRALSCTPLSPL
jgi:hypothetical protein